jgi:hypothetical protein
MFGVDGWCEHCGVNFLPQRGSLVLRSSGLTVVGGWWAYWHQALCLEISVAKQVVERFDVELLDVAWPKGASGDAVQIVPTATEYPWFDPVVLDELTIGRHGSSGSECIVCGTWKWMPMSWEAPICLPVAESRPVIASREWFGSELNAHHGLLVIRDLAELLVDVSPRDFRIYDSSDISYV